MRLGLTSIQSPIKPKQELLTTAHKGACLPYPLRTLSQEAGHSTGSQQPGVETAATYPPEIQAHGLVQFLPALQLCKQLLERQL